MFDPDNVADIEDSLSDFEGWKDPPIGDWPDRDQPEIGNVDTDEYTIIEDVLDSVRTREIGVLIDLDPRFIDPVNGDFHVMDNSPATNTGTPDTTGLGLREYDFDGEPRIYTGYIPRIDIGCYEYQANPRVQYIFDDFYEDTYLCADSLMMPIFTHLCVIRLWLSSIGTDAEIKLAAIAMVIKNVLGGANLSSRWSFESKVEHHSNVEESHCIWELRGFEKHNVVFGAILVLLEDFLIERSQLILIKMSEYQSIDHIKEMSPSWHRLIDGVVTNYILILRKLAAKVGPVLNKLILDLILIVV